MSVETGLSSTGSGLTLNPAELRRAWLSMDSNDLAISFASTATGKFIAVMIFVAALALGGQVSTASLVLIAATISAIVALPAQRLAIVCASSIFYFVVRPYRIEGWQTLSEANAGTIFAGISPTIANAGAAGLFLAIAFAVLSAMKAYPQATFAKRPVITLIGGWFAIFTAALAVPNETSLGAALWLFTGVSVSALWFFAYAAVDLKSKDPTPIAARASLMRPFWGGSALPIGKGFGYLNKFDAKDEQELAITRLKAVKLAVWALILSVVWTLVDLALYRYGSLVPLQDAVLAHAAGEGMGAATNWGVVLANYFLDLLIIAVWGHFIVAAIRMCGWRIPRNTVNPLASRTLAEFWNRYFFYFKELLVDFFFYPAFLRFFKKNTKLRIAFATLCAAGLGNFLYHFMRETHVFADRAFADALAVFPSAVFYSLVLAAGLIISQWRGRKVKPEDGFLAYHVWPRLNVMAFFCFLKIFDDITGEGTLTERAAFTLSLFGAY